MNARDEVNRIAQCVRDAGGRALLVGGCVRDELLGREVNDFDVEVYGIAPDRLVALLSSHWALDSVGAAFGVLKIRHLPIDVSLPRRENRLGAGHRDFSISADPSLPVADAASRRDFTINAILRDPLTGEMIDPWRGIEDLRRGVLRHVSGHFTEDPLRVLRAMQFLARFPLTPAPETVALCSAMTQDALARERIASEWEKLLLKGETPSRGLDFLRECGWLKFYPELEALVGCEQCEAFHPEGDVWRHTCLAVDAAAELRRRASRGADGDLVVALSALCHDFGKPKTTAMGPRGHVVSYCHETAGVPVARGFLTRIWNRPALADDVCRLVASHMRPVPLVMQGAGDRAYRRLAVEARRLDLLADVVECDVRATLAGEKSLALVREFRKRTAELFIDRAPPRPFVQGRDLIARGMKPGREFGEIISACYERQLDGEITDAASAARVLDEVLRGRGFADGEKK